MRGPAGSDFDSDMWSGGEYKEVVPMQKIVCSDHFADAEGNYVNGTDIGMPGDWPDEMTVTFTFEDAGDGKTAFSLHHEGHPAEMAEMAEQGWGESLDKLEGVL